MNNLLPITLKLPEDFLHSETRCGYTVDEEMKAVWAVELDLLNMFQKVCEKHQLQYFADAGTMLGAVRHRGFIPWDDDIDLIMMRDQYELLCKIAKDEFKDPYFFQTEFTDPGSLRGHAQIRNSRTTGIIKKEKEKKFHFNQGIFIDIFPMDAVPEDKAEADRKIQETGYYLSKARKKSYYSTRYIPSPDSKPVKKWIKERIHGFADTSLGKYVYSGKDYIAYESACKIGNEKNTEKVAKYFAIPFLENQIWYREDFREQELYPFEMLMVPLPIGYQRILDTYFGKDWMTPKKTPAYHGGVFFDAHRSYREYLEEK